MSDPLSVWFTQPVRFRALQGYGASGPVWDNETDAVTELCRIRWANTLVRDSLGNEVVASAVVSYAHDRPTYPVDSLADLGDGRWRKVITAAHHYGSDETPNYTSASVE